MFLTKKEIENHLEYGYIVIENYEPRCLKVASYVLRMSSVINRTATLQSVELIDTQDLSQARKEILHEECISPVLRPGEFILASSLERLSFNNVIGALVSPLSHISRLGIGFLGSMYIRPGFSAETPTPIVFEIVNHGNWSTKLHIGMPLCHILFFKTGGVDIESGDIDGRTDVRSGNLFSRYDFNIFYREITQQYCDKSEKSNT